MRICNIVLLAAAASMVAGMLAPAVAHAACAMPSAATAPLDGATVPPDPTVYVFVPRFDLGRPSVVEVWAGEDVLPVRQSEVSATQAFVTLRLDIRTGDSTAFEIRDAADRSLATFTVDDRWDAPADRSVRVLDTKRVEDAWTCSYTDAYFVTVSEAPAYRVSWREGEQESSAIFPAGIHDFFGGRGSQDGTGTIKLGHVSCFGHTAGPSGSIDPRSIEVAGLWPDGVEGPEAPDVELEPEPEAEACGYVPEPELEPEAQACGYVPEPELEPEPGAEGCGYVPPEPEPLWCFLATLFGGLAGLVAGASAVLPGRRRRRRR